MYRFIGGWGGIRTHGRLSPSPVFKTGTFNHSVTHPINYLLCTLGLSLWQVISKLFNYAIIFYIFYIFYILYEKVATKVATAFFVVSFDFLYKASFLVL